MLNNQLILSPITLAELKEELATLIRYELAVNRDAEVEKRLLSPKEACAVFKPEISKTTLTKWTQAGLLKSYRMGGRVYYKHGEVLTASSELKRYRRN